VVQGQLKKQNVKHQGGIKNCFGSERENKKTQKKNASSGRERASGAKKAMSGLLWSFNPGRANKSLRPEGPPRKKKEGVEKTVA